MDREKQGEVRYGYFNGLPRETEERRVEFLGKLASLIEEYNIDIGADYEGSIIIGDKEGDFFAEDYEEGSFSDKLRREDSRIRKIQGAMQYFPENQNDCPVSIEPFPFNKVIRIANE